MLWKFVKKKARKGGDNLIPGRGSYEGGGKISVPAARGKKKVALLRENYRTRQLRDDSTRRPFQRRE